MTGAMRYEAGALRGDFIRAGVGFGFCVLAVLLAGPASYSGLLFGFCGLLFLGFGLRTLLRSVTEYRVTGRGLRRSHDLGLGPRHAELAWRDVHKVSLRFFSTRRDRSKGWMHLTLSGAGPCMSLDSTLTGFESIAKRAGRAAIDNGARLSDSTRSNFLALGVRIPGDTSGEETDGR